MRRRFAAVAAVAFSALFHAPVLASSPWDEIRDPAGARAEKLLEIAARSRVPRDIPLEEAPELDSLLALRAATMIELAGGARLPHVELKFFLGEALVSAGGGRDRAGRSVLLDALEREPHSPLAAHAWFSVAIASNRLGDIAEAREAYTKALRMEWSTEQRARIYLNRGEENMALGDLSAARHDLRLALALSKSSEMYALANWGLGVALARSNELALAIDHARRAAALRFEVRGRPAHAIDLPGVFYTPDYEILYYRALAEMVAYEDADKPQAKRAALERCLGHLEEYLMEGRQNRDRWLDNVELYRAWCVRRLEELRIKQPRDEAPGR